VVPMGEGVTGMTVREALQEALQAGRAARDWSQEDAAREIGVSLRTYVRWEHGESEPGITHVRRICRAFGWKLPFLGDLDTLERLSRKVTVAA
jgi:DNA-binding XRE family transcriptional regulator